MRACCVRTLLAGNPVGSSRAPHFLNGQTICRNGQCNFHEYVILLAEQFTLQAHEENRTCHVEPSRYAAPSRWWSCSSSLASLPSSSPSSSRPCKARGRRRR